MQHKTLSTILAFVMMLEFMPVAAYAAPDGKTDETPIEVTEQHDKTETPDLSSLILDDPDWTVSDTVDEAFYSEMAALYAEDSDNIFLEMQLAADSNIVTVDGVEMMMSAAPQIQGGQLMLPVDEITEALGEGTVFDRLDAEEAADIPAKAMVNQVENSVPNPPPEAEITYLTTDEVAEKLALEVEYSEDGSAVTLTAPYQTARILVLTESKLNTELLGAKSTAYNGVGMWALQFDTPAEAKTALETCLAAGITAEPDA